MTLSAYGAEQASTPTWPEWDPQAIAKVAGANLAMQKRLLAKFVATTENTLLLIEQSLQAGNWPELTRGAHSLKSAARTVGAAALGETCAQLEAAARSGDAATCQALASQLPGVFAAVKVHIQAATAA